MKNCSAHVWNTTATASRARIRILFWKKKAKTNDINKTCARLKSFCETKFIVYILRFAIKLASIVFWSALFLFFLSLLFFNSRSDRQKLTIEKFRIAKISIVIGDHFIHSLVRHSLVRFVFFVLLIHQSHIWATCRILLAPIVYSCSGLIVTSSHILLNL